MNFAKNVKEMSKGTIIIDVFPDAQLGYERDMIEGMQLGTIDMAILTNVNVGPFVPEFMAFDLPFVFKDRATAYKVLDGPIGQKLFGLLEQKRGIIGLAWGEGGYRHMLNNVKPVRVPADVQGVKYRSLENPLYIATYKAIGSNPTPMAWSECFTGIQQKTIDGLDLPIASIYTFKYHEITKYLSLTGHFYSPLIISVSKPVWGKLTPEEQAIMKQAAKKAGDDERKFLAEIEEKFMKEIEKGGMKINKDVDISAFQKAVAPVYETYRSKIGGELIDSILKETGAK